MYRRLQHNRPSYDLTILILTLPDRAEPFARILKEVRRQAINHSVQIIYIGDNESMFVGEKRNFAKSMVKGSYFCFIDDDDMISEDYIESIMSGIDQNPDVITFEVQKYENGKEGKKQIFNNDAHRVYLSEGHYKLPPNHLCAWKTSVVDEDFPNKNLSEDHEWAANMRKEGRNVHHIPKVLYHYYYDTNMSKTHPR